ncbi:hypothetical protein I4U23_015031 [Adineta vaga]|nr:hypothetical protein I4U23_015031 [Adineta vaga]
MLRMKLYKAKDSWIVTTDEHSLWFNRRSLSVYTKPEPISDDILSPSSAWDASYVSDIYGYIGQIQIVKDGLHWLIFIKNQEMICIMHNEHEIYRVTDILVQPFDNVDEDSTGRINVTNNNKYESKCIDELRLWYQETQCFYYSRTYDLTNTMQRSFDQDKTIPLWICADDRFFWNRQMLNELIKQADREHFDTRWIQPIIMGYLNECNFQVNDGTNAQLILISRRNRHRAGVRMHCRGIDEDGNVANYVETEQILRTSTNIMSFVMIRGSVPFYWSQPGIRYRPPPKIDRSFNESHEAFIKHIDEQLERTKGNQLVLISLVDEWGKENILNDTFFEHIMKYNSSHLSYITFDFHEYCKGLQFGNVMTLLQLLDEKNMFREMRFSWINTEKNTVLSDQTSVFRINCVDCLDRTNVVQAAIAKTILEIMLKKVGLLDLDAGGLNDHARIIFQTMWADNGDAISRQYAGTDAMKGDFTRTGRRDIKGVLADGKISANRYYRRFKKDTLRQQCYDAMQKQKPATIDATKDGITTAALELENPNETITNREEILKQMILDCRKMCVCEETEDCLGTWLLINDSDLDEISVDQTEPDCVLVLTSTRYFVVCYDETFQKVISCKETPFASIDKVEIGPNPSSPPDSSWTLRIHYVKDGQTGGYYHQFRGTNVQVFNTSVMTIQTIDQINDYLKTIGQLLVSVLNYCGQKSLKLHERPLHRMNSLPDDVEPFQRRMSISVTEMPPLATMNRESTSNNTATIDKIKNFGSRFSSMVSRQAAPTFNKLTTQAKQIPINETVTSLLKVIGDSSSMIRSSTIKLAGDDERTLATSENTRKRILQEKFDERKKNLMTTQCQTKCYLLPATDLTIIYIPNNDQNN